VTTYGTVIDVPNPQLKLKPGMTATVRVEIAKRTNVLRVPNTSLRFRPTPELFAALNQAVPPEAQLASGGSRSGRGGQGRNAGAAGTGTAPSDGASATAAGPGTGAAAAAVPGGRDAHSGAKPSGADAQAGQRGGGRGGDPARMMERFKGMSPDEQKQFIARMKERGRDASAFEQATTGGTKASAVRPKYGAAAPAQTIDALFAPLPVVETRGRVWLFMNGELKPVNVRLGVSDGTFTELVSGELQQNMEVVTGVTGLGATRTLPGQTGSGNPLMPGRGPGGGFGGPGGRGR